MNCMVQRKWIGKGGGIVEWRNVCGFKFRRLHAWAEPYYLRALAVRRHRFGDGHPAVAMSLNNLGCLYQEQGLFASAQQSLDEPWRSPSGRPARRQR
ncbi:MAG: hypothetical protein OJF52_004500 [Nitrospira sp.]|jgi:hypothetical protein|nr:MAG: hypothetical protein OJF52_004500 [Nitrospira sp.]